VPTIDDKVVAMSFESGKFEEGIGKAINALEKLKSSLHFPDAGKGLLAIGQASNKVDFGGIHKGLDTIADKLSTLRLTAVAVFADIAQQALSTGTAFVKSLTLDPIQAGYGEYITKINAIQTILANTQAAGVTLEDVSKALKKLNDYSDKTIYNFGQMARNIGTFTAAGVDLDTSVSAIKGIANLAALSGSNAEQASRAMYQLSQALAAGKIGMIDWISVRNAGMGGAVFQRALAQTAEAMGTLKKGAVELSGPMKTVKVNGQAFAQSLSQAGQEPWLTSKVLTSTLRQFTGDLKDAQLAAMGFTDKQIFDIQKTAETARRAATEVKDFFNVLKVAAETAGSGWSESFEVVFGTYREAKKTFTELSNTINNFINASADARNKALGDWKKLGGRTVLINSIKTAFHNLSMVVKPIGQAFRDIFPRTTGKQLYDLTVRFQKFTEMLKPSPETVELLRRTFRGLFAILDIGKQILFGILGVFSKVFGEIGKGSGGFLEITARIGDWLVKVDQALKEGGRLSGLFEGLGKVLAAPIQALQFLADLLNTAFSGGAEKSIDGVTKSVGPLTAVLNALGEILSELSGIFQPVFQAWVDLFTQLPALLGQAISTMSFDPILTVIRTGLLGGMFLMFKKFLGKGAAIDQLTKGFVGGVSKNINNSLTSLTNALVALQQNLKAKTLKEIAIAVALLAASMLVLSFVDPKKLDSALSAVTVAFAQLLGAMTILGNISKSLGFVKIPIIAASLILLSGAIFVLSASVAALSLLSWEQLAKGLSAVAVLLGVISVAVLPLSAASFGMVKAGLGLMTIAVALNILALAVLAFGKMDLMTLGKGMGAIGIGLFIIATYIKLMPTGVSMIAQGAGLIAIAVALNILSLAVLSLGSMNLETLGKGMGAIGISLGLIAAAMHLMPKTMALQAAGLLLVAAALVGIATAVRIMGGQSLTDLAKGLGGLAYSLGLLTAALIAMSGTMTGALSLGIAAAAIALLVPALILLGNQNIKVIALGLVALALAFGVIAAAGILLDAAAPGLLAFGGAVALVGAGLALAGAGIFLAAAGLGALIGAVVFASLAIPKAFVDIQRSLVENAKLLVLGILEIVQAFADTAPQFVDAIVKILTSVIEAIIQLIPMTDKIVTMLLETLIRILDQQQGPIVEAILGLVMAILTGIRNHIGEITETVLIIIQNFLLAIAHNIGKIAKAGADIIVALIKGIAGSYAKIITVALNVIAKFLNGIANNLGKIVTAGGNIITKFLSGIARNITKVSTAATNVVVAFINGVGNAGPRIVTAATNAIIKFINALSKNGVKLADAGAKAIINFLNGVANVIEKREPEMMQAGFRIGVAVIRGFINGLGSLAGEMASKVKSLGTSAINGLRKATHTDSPSKDAHKVGQAVVQGFANGMSDYKQSTDAAMAMGNGVITAVEDVLEITSPSKVMMRIGREVTAGFAAGIQSGAEEDIRSAFGEMKRRLDEQAASLRQQIAEENKRRGELQAKGKERTNEEDAELKKLKKTLADYRTELTKVTNAQKNWSNLLTEDKGKLLEAATQYRTLLETIDKVKGKIQELKDQYSDLPGIIKESQEGTPLTGAEQLKKYTEALTAQVAAVKKYNETLQALRALGLDDETYKMLLEEGTSGQAFAEALLKGGAPAIASIKTLDTNLGTASDTLGTNAAKNLYGAGIDAANGLLAGLEAKKKELEALMTSLANTMVTAIKKKLKIKSPSGVFAEIGKLSMEGMAQGLENSSGLVTDAADQTAKDAIAAMKKSMSDISEVVTEGLDTNPVITPILDLTQVESKRAELEALTKANAITASVSTGQASAISSAKTAAQLDQVATIGGTSFKFEQNNYSPEALSDIEIYRQTKNQLSQIKAALALT
jgi:tape measure domain-containing protein